ncbi:MAG: DUF116 domain-containing protein [Actinobacteria bacterium]|nr:DUF116 domain-containing protein [Actinomycetota bacterium]
MKIGFLRRLKKQKKIEDIDFKDRVLLISHCLRNSKSCKAQMSKTGLQCRDDCPNPCSIGQLRKLAERKGYKGVCIAPGGSMAIKYVAEKQPRGIVAIACNKELTEGIEAIRELKNKSKFNGKDMPVIKTIPLTKDGCINTETDVIAAAKIIMNNNGQNDYSDEVEEL